jgi:hypothetical protein
MVYRPLYNPSTSSPDANQWRLAPWATYTPTWTSSGSAPSLGDGVTRGAYRREGTTLHLRGQLNIGSTSTVGTGEARVSLPSGAIPVSAHNQIMAATWFNASSSAVVRGVAIAQAGLGYMTFQFGDTGTRSPTSDLAVSDDINWTGTIEIDP